MAWAVRSCPALGFQVESSPAPGCAPLRRRREGWDHPGVLHPHEALIRGFYAARARRDLAAVRVAIAPDVVWHEAGSRPPYTGDLVGRDAVLAMMAKAGEPLGEAAKRYCSKVMPDA